MHLYKKEPERRDIELARNSVSALNFELKKVFGNLKDPKMILWAGDFHLHQIEPYQKEIDRKYEKIDCSRQLELCLEEINALQVEPLAVILGGDITDNSFRGEWMEFRRLIEKTGFNKITIPLFGNHEHTYSMDAKEMDLIWRDMGLSSWTRIEDPNEYFYSVVFGDYKLVILDTVSSNGNMMSDAQRSFLRDEVIDSSHNILIFQHKHIMPALNWLDEGIFRDKGMVDIIDSSEKVLGVFSGHTHKSSLWSYRDKVYGSFPAVCYGIGDKTGWGGIILDQEKIVKIFVKDIRTESYDDCAGFRLQQGSFKFLESEDFEKSPLLNPEFWCRKAE
jgi:3',5'-cyclic AMP phosphodiesterase CpdA